MSDLGEIARPGPAPRAAPRGGGVRARTDAPRSNRARPVADLLGAAGGAAFRRFGFVQHAVVTRWPEIVGPRYAGVSSPESIRFPPGRRGAGLLTLVVEGAHASMLQHVAPVIVERVNRFFGYPAIDRIALRHGRVTECVGHRGEPRAAPPPLAPVPAALGDGLREIADPELRAVLEALARALAASEGAPVVTAGPLFGQMVGIPLVGAIGEVKR